jgi:hypothetical protein
MQTIKYLKILSNLSKSLDEFEEKLYFFFLLTIKKETFLSLKVKKFFKSIIY